MKVLFLASENTPSAVVEPALEEEISGDHVLKEINAVVEGNRTLTMRAIGKKREDMDLWGICQIDVYEGREPDIYTHDKRRISLEEWIRESYERNEQEPQKPVINSFVFADVFQSGQENICILFRHLGFHWMILHEEDGMIYGIDMPVRWFCGVQKDGLYYGSGGAADAYYKRMTFENGDYIEHEIAHISYDELIMDIQQFWSDILAQRADEIM